MPAREPRISDKNHFTQAVCSYRMPERKRIDRWFCGFAAAAVIISVLIAVFFHVPGSTVGKGIGGAVKVKRQAEILDKAGNNYGEGGNYSQS